MLPTKTAAPLNTSKTNSGALNFIGAIAKMIVFIKIMAGNELQVDR